MGGGPAAMSKRVIRASFIRTGHCRKDSEGLRDNTEGTASEKTHRSTLAGVRGKRTRPEVKT